MIFPHIFAGSRLLSAPAVFFLSINFSLSTCLYHIHLSYLLCLNQPLSVNLSIYQLVSITFICINTSFSLSSRLLITLSLSHGRRGNWRLSVGALAAERRPWLLAVAAVSRARRGIWLLSVEALAAGCCSCVASQAQGLATVCHCTGFGHWRPELCRVVRAGLGDCE